ncbi:MAG: LptA/OstA family protein, partial [Acidobacteriaceae bacterium]
ISTATAARAEYDGANDTLTLTGEPVFRDASLEMTAERFEVQRAAGKMLATGAVQTTVHSSTPSQAAPGGLLSGNQPTHVIARQALLLHDAQKAIFTGQARLWQGGSSVEAPVIEMSQKMQTLTAYSNGPCTECVHTTFLGQSAEPAQQGRQKTSKAGKSGNREHGSPETANRGPSTFRVLSGRLLYSDAERKASFSDHVEAISSSGNVFADQAEVFLTPASPRSQAKPGAALAATEKKTAPHSNNSPQSSVERIVATGHVVLEQPGRRGTGTRLVYTASDGHFVLTGDGANPPQVVDSIQGTVTGQVLTFSSRTQAIIVSGTSNDAAVTKTRVQKK